MTEQTNGVAKEDDFKDVMAALEHCRELFVYHANQRLQSIRFYFVAFGIFIAGYAAAFAGGTGVASSLLSAVLALGALTITESFRRLDLRNAELVDCDEAPLKILEKIVADRMKLPDFETIKNSDTRGGGNKNKNRYGIVMPRLFRFSAFFSGALLSVSLVLLVWSLLAPWANIPLCLKSAAQAFLKCGQS